MPALNNSEIIDLFAGVQSLRRSSRTMEFSQITLEQVRSEALDALGGGRIKDSIDPLGKIDRLNLLEQRVTDMLAAVRARHLKTLEEEAP